MTKAPTRPRPLRDAALALSLLTVVPTGVRWPDGERTDTAAWMPAVGLALGGVVWGCLIAVPAEYLASHAFVVSALVVAAFALATRLLHYDGLADVADAWWGGASPSRRLEIMSDSATGAFGASAVALAVAAQVAAVSTLLASGLLAPLLIAPALARLAPLFAAWLGTPAREGGLGRSVMGRPSIAGVAVAGLTLVAIAWLAFALSGVAGVVYAAAGVAIALVVPHVIAGRMGGVTGDVMGASVILVETALYLGAALATGVVTA